MRIVGIDPNSFVIAMGMRSDKKKRGTGAHLVRIGDGLEIAVAEPRDPKLAKKKTTRARERFTPLVNDFAIVIRGLKPTYCYVEEPIYAGSFPATLALGMICGAMSVVLDGLEIPWSFVGNNTWKKALLGGGKATKDEIRAWVLHRFPALSDDLIQDVYDAVAIAEWGYQACGGAR